MSVEGLYSCLYLQQIKAVSHVDAFCLTSPATSLMQLPVPTCQPKFFAFSNPINL